MKKSNKIYNQVLNTVLTKENKMIVKINKTIKNKDSITPFYISNADFKKN